MDVALSSDGTSLAAISNDGNLYYFRTGVPAPVSVTATETAGMDTVTEGETVFSPLPTAPPVTFQTVATPKPEVGVLKVDSVPEGADVYVDHRYVGMTPLRVPDLPRGTHRVGLILAGYVEWSTDVEISNNRVTTISAPLVPRPTPTKGEVQLSTLVLAGCAVIMIVHRYKAR